MTSQAIASQIPQSTYGLCSYLSLGNVLAASSILEAGFYASINGGFQSSGRLFNWIREEASIDRIHTIQTIFNTINFGMILYCANQLVSEVFEKISLTVLPTFENWFLKQLGTLGLLALVFKVSISIADFFFPLQDLSKEEEGAEILGNQQSLAHLFYIMKMVVNIALACFIKNKVMLAVSLAGSSYCLWKNIHIDWMSTPFGKWKFKTIDSQSSFEHLYAIYNVAQAALSYLQTYPEIALAVFKIQQILLITDFIGYGMTAYYLYKNISDKYILHDSEMFTKVAIIATLVATAALSCVFVFQLNAYLRSAVVLKNLFSQLPVSPELLKGIEVGWSNPLAQQLLQCLYVNRIVSLVALTFFSNQKKTNLISAVAQLTSFAGISNLKWITFSQIFNSPLENIARVEALFLKERLKSIILTTSILVDPRDNLSSTVQSIYNYSCSMFNIFKTGFWGGYWLITYSNGMPISREFWYKVTLQRDLILPILPNLRDFGIKILDIYGNTKLSISYL